MYKHIMQALAEAGEFEEAFNIMHRMYTITKREDIHQFGESQLAYVAGNMVGLSHTQLAHQDDDASQLDDATQVCCSEYKTAFIYNVKLAQHIASLLTAFIVHISWRSQTYSTCTSLWLACTQISDSCL